MEVLEPLLHVFTLPNSERIHGTVLRIIRRAAYPKRQPRRSPAAKRSGRSVIVRPIRMPPALPASLAEDLPGEVYFCFTRYSAHAMKSRQVFGFGQFATAAIPLLRRILRRRAREATAITPPCSIPPTRAGGD